MVPGPSLIAGTPTGLLNEEEGGGGVKGEFTSAAEAGVNKNAASDSAWQDFCHVLR